MLQDPKLLVGSSKAVKETVNRLENAFERIAAFAP